LSARGGRTAFPRLLGAPASSRHTVAAAAFAIGGMFVNDGLLAGSRRSQ